VRWRTDLQEAPAFIPATAVAQIARAGHAFDEPAIAPPSSPARVPAAGPFFRPTQSSPKLALREGALMDHVFLVATALLPDLLTN
jgi:hypothetical protein